MGLALEALSLGACTLVQALGFVYLCVYCLLH